MTIEEAIAAVKANECYAMVFQSREPNTFDLRSGRFIIRKINTLGGPKVAMHELTFGCTGSGMYDEEFYVPTFKKMVARFGIESFEWRAFNELDLPINLVAL